MIPYGERIDLARTALEGARVRGSGWARANCPFCIRVVGKDDRDRSLSIHTEHGGFRCHRCGTSGCLQAQGGDAGALEELRGRVPDGDDARRPPDGFVALASHEGVTSEALDPAREYLRERGVAEALWSEIGIGAVATGVCGNRVVIPVLADDGSWLGWCARLWQAKCDRKKKYRFPDAMPRGDVLFNHRALYERTDEPVYVVEGAFDALPFWPHAVAVFGDTTDTQLEALALAKRPVVFVPDGDAWQKGEMLAYRLQLEGQCAGWVRLPPKVDPDQCSPADLWEAARANLRRL